MRHIAIALVVLGGCAEFAEGTYMTPTERAFEDKALPVFQASCMSCHADPAGAQSFLVGDTPAEIRDSVLASGVVNLDDVPNSLLFVKGLHSGPAMSVRQAVALLEWLEVERTER